MLTTDKKLLLSLEVLFIIGIGLSSSMLLINPNVSKIVVRIQFVLYCFILITNYYRQQSFNLYQVWIVGYIFMVWSEMEILSVSSDTLRYTIPFVRFSLANMCVMVGYVLAGRQKNSHFRYYILSGGNKLFVLLVSALYLYYVLTHISSLVSVFFNGRSYGEGSSLGTGSLLSTLTGSLAFFLPAVMGYYFRFYLKKSAFRSFVISLPIFLILLFTTSRYKFLFSIFPYLIVTGIFDIREIRLKKNILLLLVAILLISVTGFLKQNRRVALAEVEASELFGYGARGGIDVLDKIAHRLSPEGVIEMASIADDYFQNHSLRHGRETGFIFIFWIPRRIWPDKPTMLDHWLIREFSNVDEGYSSASGFIGELRADFGWGCLLFMLLFGFFLRNCDNYAGIIAHDAPGSFNIVLISLLFPWVFFFVRSPITSTMSLIWELLLWRLVIAIFAKSK